MVTRKLLIGAVLIAALSSIANPQESPGPPLRLIVTYRCPPPRRAAFRLFLNESGMQRFERWKQDGILQDYRVLLNWYVDADTWDGMAILSFPNYAEVAEWREIERISPGGLPRDALELAWPFNSYPADDGWSESAQPPAAPAKAVYFAIAYDYTNLSDFREFAGAYLIPQYKGWMREGSLAGYDLYLARYASGKKWQALLLLQYRDLDAFSRRDQTIAKVRAQLMKDPVWKAIDEKKQKPGIEKEIAIADPMLAH
jgi:hypothetical protein